MGILNYIVAFYFGERMHRIYSQKTRENKFYFMEKHIEFLQSKKGDDIDLVTFVINSPVTIDRSEIEEKFNSYDINFPLEVIVRPNEGFSYGAWNEVINKNVNDFKYFFINEDDYIPESKDFYKPFLNKLSESSPYVALMTSMERKKHASFSCGVLEANACKKVYSKYGNVFKIIPSDTYNDAWINQFSFYDNFLEEGYSLEDIIDEYQLPYMDSSKDSITYYGDFNSPFVLLPIEFEHYNKRLS